MSQATCALVPGAIIIHGVIPECTAKALNREIDEAIDQVASKVGLTADLVNQLCSTWDDQAGFVHNAASSVEPALAAALAVTPEFADESFERQEASLFVGSYSRGDSTHAHQDIAYRWNRPQRRYAMTTWLALDQCDGSSGALLFSRAASNCIEIRQDFLSSDFIDRATTPTWITGQIVAAVQPGDAVVFDSHVWHAAAGFSNPGQRRALAVRWRSASGQEHERTIPEPVIDASRFGIDTAGALLKSAILQAYPYSTNAMQHTSLQHCVDWVIAKNSNLAQDLGTAALNSLRQLSRAQHLAENYSARPALQVWQSIRDIAIPELRALSNKR